MGKGNELTFQNDMIEQFVANGWLLGKPENYNRELALYAHLQIQEKEDWEGRKTKKETLIFPRYHQWDVVNKLIDAAHTEGPGYKYLVQHSAGSGKADRGVYILDFFNDPKDILESFQPYYQTAELADVSDPDLIFDLFDKLRAAGIFLWHEVEQFCQAFLQKSKSNAAIANICKPAVERWKIRYKSAIEAYRHAKNMFERTQKTADAVLITNAEKSFKECKKEKDALEIFKKDLGTFVRFYEFMSQIVDYDNKDLEKLSLYARHLRPMLRESLITEDEIDLNNIVLSHYRLSEIRRQDLKLQEGAGEYKLKPGEALGTAKARDIKEAFMSQIINRLNELFITDQLTRKDLVNYAYTIRDKVGENEWVMMQIANNTPEQAMLGDFPKAVDDAVMDSNEAHHNQMMQLLSDRSRAAGFARVVFDLLKMAD